MVILALWAFLSGGLISNQFHYETCKSNDFKITKCSFQKKLDSYGKR